MHSFVFLVLLTRVFVGSPSVVINQILGAIGDDSFYIYYGLYLLVIEVVKTAVVTLMVAQPAERAPNDALLLTCLF